MRLNRLRNSHTFEAIHEEELSSMQGGLLTIMLGIIAERPKNGDDIEEDGCCTRTSNRISIVGKDFPNKRGRKEEEQSPLCREARTRVVELCCKRRTGENHFLLS